MIGFLLVAAVILFALRYQPQEDFSYNGFAFQKGTCAGTQVTCWYGDFYIRDQDYTISFYHHPSEVDTIGVAPLSVRTVYNFQNVQGGTVYIGVPKNAPGSIGIAATELSRILGTRYDIFNFNIKAGIIGSAQDQLSCANATPYRLIILLEQQDIDAVTLTSPHCITIGAVSAEQATRVTNAFSYKLLSVIPLEQNATTP